MAFRADESARESRYEAERFLLGRLADVTPAQLDESKRQFHDLVDRLGPVVRAYPTWHPLVADFKDRYSTRPSVECGYKGLENTILFVHGFITCPFGDGADEVIESVRQLKDHSAAHITAEKMSTPFYSSQATPVLVTCGWDRPLAPDNMIPLSLAMPLLLEKEVPCWRYAQVAETWDSMKAHFLGLPHGSRSSLFVSQETGSAMKKVWETIIHTGMYGPIKV